MAVIFKPKQPLIVANSDINIAVERRNKAPASMGLMTMVTAVAHVWFNVFFEGRGPEQGGKADDSGVFEIEWDKMDGIKGSSQKGTRALDRLAVVWRTVESAQENKAKGEPSSTQGGLLGSNQGAATIHLTRASTEIREPGEGEEVPQMAAADWKGDNKEDPEAEKRLGLRVQDPDSANVSKASSIIVSRWMVSAERMEEGRLVHTKTRTEKPIRSWASRPAGLREMLWKIPPSRRRRRN